MIVSFFEFSHGIMASFYDPSKRACFRWIVKDFFTMDKSLQRLQARLFSRLIQQFRYHFLEALNTVSTLFYKDGVDVATRIIGMIGLERVKYHWKPRDTVIKPPDDLRIPGIGQIQIKDQKVKGLLAENPLQYFTAVLCRSDPVAFSHHFSFQELPHMRIAVRYQYGELSFQWI